MDAAHLLRSARLDAGLTLRELAARAATSHSTLAAYESGRTVPTVDTLDRVLRAAGYAIDVELTPRSRDGRGRELEEVLDLAEQFPARHAPTIQFPKFAAA
ncbi:MAG: helix-turn-helix domain-containing protein [Ilumatobacter sp.]|uniref:helix-turn-helix domain-containing protein n=1 Tax=Ilumatobacter sp. TaxID=1967498 RepID=UPI003919C899